MQPTIEQLRQQQSQLPVQQKEPWADSAPAPRFMLEFAFGLNENVTPTMQECTQGYNFDLAYAQRSLVPRLPFDLVSTAPNAGAVTGIQQLVKRDGTQTTMVSAGAIQYQWDGASTWTNKGSITAPAYLRDTYWSLGDYIILTDVKLNNVVSKWDGTTFGAITTGLAQPLYAKYAAVQNNRVWLFNIKYGTTSYPHMILACKFEDPTNWDTSTRGGPTTVGGGSFSTGLEAFYLLTPDLRPINGVMNFQNSLIISTQQGHVYQLTGSSSQTYQFVDFYDTAPAIADEGFASIGNDGVFLRQGGQIALLSATQAYGNAFTSNLSSWLPKTTANLSTVNGIVYDVLNQRVLFFVPGQVLVLYKNLLAQDRYQVEGNPSPWGVYTTNDSSSFNSNGMKFMYIPGTTNYSVFWGDSTGRVFNMYGTGSQDAGSSPVQVYRRSRHIGPELLQPWPWDTENIIGRINYRRLTSTSATVSIEWDEEYSTTSSVLNLKGPLPSDVGAYFGGSYYYNATSYYNQGFGAVGRVSSMILDIGGKGPGFYLNVSLPTNVPTQIDSITFD